MLTPAAQCAAWTHAIKQHKLVRACVHQVRIAAAALMHMEHAHQGH
jgi:hypothetical protein